MDPSSCQMEIVKIARPYITTTICLITTTTTICHYGHHNHHDHLSISSSQPPRPSVTIMITTNYARTISCWLTRLLTDSIQSIMWSFAGFTPSNGYRKQSSRLSCLSGTGYRSYTRVQNTTVTKKGELWKSLRKYTVITSQVTQEKCPLKRGLR